MNPAGAGVEGPPPLPPILGPPPPGFAEIGSWVAGLAFGGFLAFLILWNADGEEPFAMSLSLAIQFCLPGLLALLAWRGRPSLYLAASVVGMVVPFTAMSIGIPFFIPAGMALVAYGRRAGEVRGKLADPVVAVLSLALVMAAFASLFVHEDPYCRTGPNFSDCSSDIVTPVESTLSLGFSLVSIVAPTLLSAPGKRAPSPIEALRPRCGSIRLSSARWYRRSPPSSC